MSKQVIERLTEQFKDRILATSDFRGDDVARVRAADWLEVATFLKTQCGMNQFIDMTAVDYPEREPEDPRFDVVLFLRSFASGARVGLKTRVPEEQSLPSLVSVWAGADWAEREIYDMFGIRFDGHPDLRRILLYEEFVGYPLRKDYPIEKTQPLVPYRDNVEELSKLPPFGLDEGQPFGRIDWRERLRGRDLQVSPAIAVQTGQRKSLSESSAGESAASTEE